MDEVNYRGVNYYVVKLSDIEKIADEQGMLWIDDEVKVGDYLYFDPKPSQGFSAQKGYIAIVTEGFDGEYITVKWITKTEQMNGGYELCSFRKATEEEINLIKQEKTNKLPKEYIVKCGNDIETAAVCTHIKEYDCQHYDYYKYVIAHTGQLSSDLKDCNVHEQIPSKVEHFPTFSFNEWERLLKQENNKNMKNQELIGYKLIKPEYNQQVVQIMGCDNSSYKGLTTGTLVTEGGVIGNVNNHPEYLENLKEAGVLDIWFEPVYGVTEWVENMGDFDLNVKNNVVMHKSEDITQYVNDVHEWAKSIPQKLGSYDFHIDLNSIKLIKTGCERKTTTLKSWIDLYNKLNK